MKFCLNVLTVFVAVTIFGLWFHNNEYTLVFYDGEQYFLGKPVSERRSVSVLKVDLQILVDTRELIQQEHLWSRSGMRECDNAIRRSLFCALQQSQLLLTGGYEHRSAANQQVRFAIDDLYPSRWAAHRLTEFNAHPDTTHRDILRVLDAATATTLKKLRSGK